jgi:hypothetical protein
VAQAAIETNLCSMGKSICGWILPNTKQAGAQLMEGTSFAPMAGYHAETKSRLAAAFERLSCSGDAESS